MEVLVEGNLFAVIVGIDGYKDRRPLDCAANDAVSLAGTLKKVWNYPDRQPDIIPLVWPNREKLREREFGLGIGVPENAYHVTRSNILEMVRAAAGRCEKEDTFLFYFSGHGVLMDDEPALLTIGDPGTAKGIEYIKLRDIQEAAAGAACKKRVMILDCCQEKVSGVVDSVEVEEHEYEHIKALAGDWWIFLSCSPGEASLEDQYLGEASDDYLQQGIFTASLVAGLRGEAVAGGGGAVTLTELASYASKRVPAEYRERLKELLKKRGKTLKGRHPARLSQHPVLVGGPIAVGGPNEVNMAPVYVPMAYKAARSLPGKLFFRHWYKSLFGKWRVGFPLKNGFRIGGGLLYALILVLSIIWQSAKAEPPASLIVFWVVVGVGSFVTWWSSLSFAVAVNEDRWFLGGYLTLVFFLVWHGIIALWFGLIFGFEVNPVDQTNLPKLYHIGSDLFLFYVTVAICGINASQAIIALAETLRPEHERGDIRQAIRAFQEFRKKSYGVTIYNSIPMVTARPILYFVYLFFAVIIVGYNIFDVIPDVGLGALNWWVFLLRNMLTLVWVSWLSVWYLAAFMSLRMQLYPR
jgi:hypothetical protein